MMSESNLCLKAARPNVGKLLNPQPSAALKNHWKHAQRKLPTNDLKSSQTCFLHPTKIDYIRDRDNESRKKDCIRLVMIINSYILG